LAIRQNATSNMATSGGCLRLFMLISGFSITAYSDNGKTGSQGLKLVLQVR